MDGALAATFLSDGGQSAEAVAAEVAQFLQGARTSLDIAVYDFALTGQAAVLVAGALQLAQRQGVAIRLAYYDGPPVPEMTPPAGQTARYVESLGVTSRRVTGQQALMHDKYIVRDGGAVWTGTANWTNDSWTRQENILLQVLSPELAACYSKDFEQLWQSGEVENTGEGAGGDVTLSFASLSAPAQVWFSPAEGETMAHAVADAINGAQQRVVLASPVLSAGSILGALLRATERGLPVQGLVDATQMQEVLNQWKSNPRASWKPDAFRRVAEAAQLAGKRSTPFGQNGVHDYMHAKIMVVDDVTFTGSYNFSNKGEENAENMLAIHNHAFANTCAGVIERWIERYASSSAV